MNKISNKKLNIKLNKKDWLYISILSCYFVLNCILAFYHEPWRDESQAWVLGHNLNCKEIFKICASEGHPCLWFFLIKFTIWLGLPFKYFSAVSILFTTIATAIMIWKSNFSVYTKIALVFSPLFYYYNPVICRVYAILLLLICILCFVWEKRFEKPLIYGIIVALLFQSHVLIFGLAIGCIFDMLINLVKNRKKIGVKLLSGMLLPCFSCVVSIIELRQNNTTETFIMINKSYIIGRLNYDQMFENLYSVFYHFSYDVPLIGLLVMIIVLAFVIVSIVFGIKKEYRKKYYHEAIVIFWGCLGYFAVVILVRASVHIQMSLVLWMIVLFGAWILRIKKDNVVLEILLLCLCLICIPKSFVFDSIKDIDSDYSGSREIYQIVKKNVEDGSVILINNGKFSTAIAAYLSEKQNEYLIWDIDNGQEYTINKWGSSSKRTVTCSNVVDFMNEDALNFSDRENIYYIQVGGEPIKVSDNQELKSIDGNKEKNICDEYYWLYKIR